VKTEVVLIDLHSSNLPLRRKIIASALLAASGTLNGCQGANGSVVTAPNMPLFGAPPSSQTVRSASIPDRLYIANRVGQGSSTTGNVAVYSSGGKSFVKTIAKTLSYPTSVLLSGGSLYVGDAGKYAISVFDVANGKLTATLTQDISDPISLALDSMGTLYVANYVYYKESTVAVFSGGKFAYELTKGLHGLGQIAVDKNNNLYLPNDSQVDVYPKGAKSPKLHIRKGVALPIAVAFDSENNVYVCNLKTHNVTVYKEGSTTLSRRFTIAENPSALVVGHNDYVYVASYSSNEIEIFQPGAKRPTVVIPNANDPSALAVDGRNNLYALDSAGVTVYDATTGILERTLTKNISYASALTFGN
jgi:sugar lactone lactonase YvrE